MEVADKDIIEALYMLYEQAMYFEAYKILRDDYLAEDAVQEAFLRLIRHRKKIADPKAPATRRYVYKTLKSAALDIYRGRKKQRDNCCEFDDAIENTYADIPSDIEKPIAMISELPEKYACVMRCLFLDGLSIRETSAVLRISESCVRKRCERGRKILKETKNL